MYSRLHQRNTDFRKVLGFTPDITSGVHLNSLIDREILNSESDDFSYKNTLIQYTNDTKYWTHDKILDSLKRLANVEISDTEISINDISFKFSTDISDPHYLNFSHPIFERLPLIDNKSNAELFSIRNKNDIDLFFCVKNKGKFYPIFLIDDITEIMIHGRFKITSEKKGYNKKETKSMVKDVLNSNESHIINHSRITFSGKVSFYKSLEYKKIGFCKFRITN